MTNQPFGPEGHDPLERRDGDAVPGAAFRARRDDELLASAPRTRRKQRSPVRNLIEWLLVIGGALVVALVIKTFLFQAFYIPSESMEPTLTRGDRVLVNKLSDDLGGIDRGDVIVFHRPPNEPPSEIDDLIKRVVGLPGETVEGRDGRVWVDGAPLEEPYLADGVLTDPFAPIEVPEGGVFVMGDNRGNSRDSRVFGPIDEELIVGRAFVTVWPLGRLGGL
ncbi:signal peptidase I [Actinomarinicola tropica]|uniref:Signal peptidase I n=1 Tax=Actinomarinicola tropica TaxID=2789776 RepID=A0A5Q2RN14_9ACTN|nr:signal peptidase I [Actinomarinicola tropica]QGG95290.1 signal peptidase I [Actinomarinicola tropica]